MQFLDTGHFALETHVEEITFAMKQLLLVDTARQGGEIELVNSRLRGHDLVTKPTDARRGRTAFVRPRARGVVLSCQR